MGWQEGGAHFSLWNTRLQGQSDPRHSYRHQSSYCCNDYLLINILFYATVDVDRLPLVSSAIINVAQDVNEPWVSTFFLESRMHTH